MGARTKRKRTVGRRKRLTRDVILEAALEILTAEGVPALTMRRLAQRLGVEAMSLYNHIADKRDVLNGVVTLVISRIEIPDPALPWPSRLEAAMLGLYKALAAHPQVVMLLASDQATPQDLPVLSRVEAVIDIMRDAGLSPAQQVSAFRGMLAVCFGLVMNHTLGLSVSHSDALAHFAQWDPRRLMLPELPSLSGLAPQFLKTTATDDLRFMIEGFLKALGAQPSVKSDLDGPRI
ncbi:MAG: TetR family transcriptional regulator [Alphaproteobacteria bacterium]|nr:TetR family transcriptional regulator [Alphaproteobacteria bacterium]MBL6938948.1 TetR family transcriptional regulator [Alphaproteobacteria bacterium]MBL7099540.1 TetR family transcriptional regulator [Alphaproteobacteria bacterium]